MTEQINAENRITDSSFECSKCAKRYSTLAFLEMHQQEAHKKTIVHCVECGLVLRTNWNLKRHIMETHKKIKWHRCQHKNCTSKYSRKRNLVRHMKKHLQDNCSEESYPACHERFYRIDSLSRHENSDEQEEEEIETLFGQKAY